MKRTFPWFEALLIVVFMGIQIYAAFSDAYALPNAWFIRDDAYYYFKVAQNISEGHGSTFDGIHPTNGYHPLWMLVCIPVFALARFDLILPLRVLLVLMSGLSLATAILLYRLLGASLSPAAGAIAALYWSFNYYNQGVFYETGLESGLALFFLVLLLHRLYKLEQGWRSGPPGLKQIAGLALITALAILSRLDLVFFGAVVGVWVVFRSVPLRYLLPLDILAIFAAALASFITRLGLPAYYGSAGPALILIGAALVVKIPVFYFFGLYRPPSSWKPADVLVKILPAVVISSLVLLAILMGGGALGLWPPFSRAVLALDAAATFGSVMLLRALIYASRNRSGPVRSGLPLDDLKDHGRTWLREGSVFYGILGGALAAYTIWNRLEFGTFTPVSGQIKRWWASSAINIYGSQAVSLTEFLGLDPNVESNAWPALTSRVSLWYNYIFHTYRWAYPLEIRHRIYPILLVLLLVAVAGVLYVWRKRAIGQGARTAVLPLFVGSWLQILSYSATGYASPKQWYWLTEQVLLIIMGVLLITLAFGLLSRMRLPAEILILILIAWFSLPMVYRYGRDVYLEMPHGTIPPGTPYMETVPFLESLTRPGDVIGMTGGGNVGYFIHDRTIVNMDGLINSYDYFLAMQDGRGADYLYDTGTRYVFASPYLLKTGPYRGQYTNRLQSIMDWGGKELMRLLPGPGQ
jgi:hypothetical protein